MADSGLVISTYQDVTVVNFRDSSILDGVVMDAIDKELTPLIDQQARRKMILDFSEVRFLSSSMIGVLINLHKKSLAIKGKIVICGLRDDLMKVFKMARLDKMLAFARDETEAMKCLDVFVSP